MSNIKKLLDNKLVRVVVVILLLTVGCYILNASLTKLYTLGQNMGTLVRCH